MPLSATLKAFQTLKAAGKIRDYGVSNFDVEDTEKAVHLEGGKAITTNCVLHSL